MRRRQGWVGVLVAGTVALGPGTALAAKMETGMSGQAAPAKVSPTAQREERGEHAVAPDRIVTGQVASVEVPAKTLTVTAMRGKEKATIGVEVPATARIVRGKARASLGDLRVGDHVWMKYDRLADKLVADEIRIEGRS